MAIGTINLHLPGFYDATDPPGLAFDAHNVAYVVFADDDEEIMRWKINVPDNYASAPHLMGTIKMEGTNTTDGVVIAGRLQAVTPDNNEEFATGGYSTQVLDRVVVDDDANDTVSFDLTLNNDGMAPDDELWIEFSRVGDDTTTETDGDDAVGDMGLMSIKLEYTTT